MAGMDAGTATTTKDLGTVASRGLFRTLASIGQYVVPLIFAAGAVANVLGQRKREQLVAQVAGSASPASLGEMSWSEFEGLVQEAFRLKGYSVRRLGGNGPDGGVDLVLERGAEKALVQCKQWRALRVGVSVVRELYGVMAAQGAAAGYVVTSGSFTPDAVEFASGRNVEVQASAPRVDTQRRSEPSISSGGATGCPVCGSPMVRREARRGANAGRAFYGCSRYPACRGIRAIE
jgi:restriction system protein